MQLTIEKLVYGGDGLARTAPDERGRGKTVFLPFVAPGEEVNATIIENRKGFARAELNRVVASSPERVEAGCPYFGACGGCHYQHLNYEAQLRFKNEILHETLRRTAKLELQAEVKVHAAEPWGYRNRTRLQVHNTHGFELGYFLHNSHELLPVEACPISSPLINQAIAALWRVGRDQKVLQSLHSLQFLTNHNDTQLLLEGYVHPCGAEECDAVAQRLHSALPEVVGTACFAAAGVPDESQPATSPSMQPGKLAVSGNDSLMYHAAGHDFRISTGSFFQTNRFLIDELVQVVTGNRTGRTALDLYAGAGLFTQALAHNFDQILAVEASVASFADLRYNVSHNVKCVHTTTESFLRDRAKKFAPDLVVVDPPRGGLGERVCTALGRMSASAVTYVSCDPATLARDLAGLLKFGFRVEQAHLVDLFPQTFHLETVLQLAR